MSQHGRGTEAERAEDRRDAERRATRMAAIAFVASALGGIGLAVVYGLGGQPQAEGALLAVSLGGLGYGVALWGKHLMPSGPFQQAREEHTSAEQQRAFEATFDAGEEGIQRRRFLGRLLLGAGGALGLALVFPLRSLGPAPRRSLSTTAWSRGSRVVREDGSPVRPEDVVEGGILTVFPEGHAGRADSQVVLLRVGREDIVTRPGRASWAPAGLLAYSKVCTHAGCPVGLYQERTRQLLCPCHQSLFDVMDGARPVFGPATRSLPQLPLFVGDDGWIRAQRDFTEPIGPGYWNRR